MMYSKLPHLVVGFHGCDLSVYNKVIKDGEHLRPSENVYDWLGHGIYLWENNLSRAYSFAEELKENGKIETAAVIGTVIDLGYCLNFVDSECLQLLKLSYEMLKADCINAKINLPENRAKSNGSDFLLRNLDCAVIERIHRWNIENGYLEFHSVRGVFWEGNELYPNSGFKEKNHIQICIRNINCIKGYFSPLEASMSYPIP